MDASADVVRSPEGDGTLEGVEPGSLLWARRQIEEVKAGLRDDPGRAYSVQFTAAAEMLREHDPVQFRSLRSLLKTKLIRLGEFDRLESPEIAKEPLTGDRLSIMRFSPFAVYRVDNFLIDDMLWLPNQSFVNEVGERIAQVDKIIE